MFTKTLIATIVFLILDAIWLGFLAKQMYINSIGSILKMSNGAMDPNWGAAIVVYVALIAGLMIFVIPKANNNALMALIWGGLFGMITYAVYDFTCMAVLSTWSLQMSVIDTLWGMVICGLTSFFTVYLSQLLTR